MRQYALEKLGESGEADNVRRRHRDHYTAMADRLRCAATSDHLSEHVEQAESEIDNLRAAFIWSRENNDIDNGFGAASSLQPLWLSRQGRFAKGGLA